MGLEARMTDLPSDIRTIAETIPEDIWLTAEHCMPYGMQGDAGVIAALRHNIEHALLAEREAERERIAKLFDDRAARIKERMDKYPCGTADNPDDKFYQGALIDAAMIRSSP
jgi:hypothetical protein